MATITVKNGVYDQTSLLLTLDVVTAKAKGNNPSMFTAADDIDTYNVSGRNFTYEKGSVSGGTIFGVNWYENGKLQLTLDDVKLDAKALDSAFDTGLENIEKIVTKAFSGNDLFNGGNGKDDMHGFAGNDRLNGADGNDILYGGDGNDTINGGAGNDEIYGDLDPKEKGKDVLFGNDGNDTLVGGSLKDDLTGGKGADVFAFVSAPEFTTVDFDTIHDFSHAEGDHIRLTAFGPMLFIGKDGFNPEMGTELRYFQKGGDTFIQINKVVDFDTVPDMVIKLEGKVDLVADDFYF